jgi:hypothetical protein
MGWDAYVKKEYITPEVKVFFEEKSEECISKTGSVDADLSSVGLDCSTCKNFLQDITNVSCYEGWAIDKTNSINPNWKMQYTDEDSWAYWSARYFLEGVMKFNLPVTFSY